MPRPTWIPIALAGLVLAGAGLTAHGAAGTLALRYQRDVSRMVFNDNLRVLVEARRAAGAVHDSLSGLLGASMAPPPEQPYVVVSIVENRLWLRQGDSILFSAPVATGSGRVLERVGEELHWRFETPRGRLTVLSRDTAPAWVAPDWHYVELAQNRGLGLLRLNRGDEVPLGEGVVLTVAGSDVVRRYPDGRIEALPGGSDEALVVGANVVIPPFGTNQRKYPGVLGTHRLNLGNGYAIHGTNQPESVGRSVSHGCIRLRNEDIAVLYRLVPDGTPVYVY